MIKKIVIRNKSSSELGVMLEPWTTKDDIGAGNILEIAGNFVDDEIVIDVFSDNFVSVWSPPGSTITKVNS
jgi:hypothetical protein